MGRGSNEAGLTAFVVLIALAILIPAVAAILLLEIWIGVHIVQLVLAYKFGAAYLWCVLGAAVLMILGGINAMTGTNK